MTAAHFGTGGVMGSQASSTRTICTHHQAEGPLFVCSRWVQNLQIVTEPWVLRIPQAQTCPSANWQCVAVTWIAHHQCICTAIQHAPASTATHLVLHQLEQGALGHRQSHPVAAIGRTVDTIWVAWQVADQLLQPPGLYSVVGQLKQLAQVAS